MQASFPAWRWERCLQALGLESLPELLMVLPHRYLDYREPVLRLRDLMLGEQAYVVLYAREAPCVVEGRVPRIEFVAEDNCAEAVRIVCFGAINRFNWVEPGKVLHLYGRLDRWRDELRLQGPVFIHRSDRGRILPVYRRCPGVVSADAIRNVIQAHLENWAPQMAARIVARSGLPDEELMAEMACGFDHLVDLFRALHRPADLQQADQAVEAARRLAAFEVVHRARQNTSGRIDPRSAFRVEPELRDQLLQRVPFTLTADQVQAIDDILGDLKAERPMRRLLSGEYGTGKTITYTLAAVAARQVGARVAILMPNVLLAEQVAAELAAVFGDCPHALVTGTVRRLPSLDENPVLIGTTALLYRLSGLQYAADFVIIDEQQKLSREQRETLLSAHSNLLEVTATCIPRTMALVQYGCMHLSTLKTCPVEKVIHTQIVENPDKRRMFEHVRRIVAEGGQVAIVYPEVEAGPEVTRLSVEAAAKRWQERFPGQVEMLHGKMAEAQKLAVLERMKRGEFKVLICSTVIEVGVTIPALRAVVVVQAERYGVTTLHQLRGRVARLGGEGWFYLFLPLAAPPQAMERLRLLELYTDGFALAEEDMRQRGFGDLEHAASRQAGRSISLFQNLKLMPGDVMRALGRIERSRDSGPQAPLVARQPVLRQCAFQFDAQDRQAAS